MYRTSELIPVVFPDHRHVEEAAEHLMREGIADPHLRTVAHRPFRVTFEGDAQAEVLHAVKTGVLWGIPAGIVAGTILVGIAFAFAGTGSFLAAVAAGGWGGAIGGVFFGGLTGLLVRLKALDLEEELASIPMQAHEALLVAKSHGMASTVRAIVEEHGGRVVAMPRAA